MDFDERSALFRAHATAVLTGDTAEANRTHRLIDLDHLLPHQVFVFALFAVCVSERFGDELDWSAIESFMAEVRRSYPEVSALKTEALVRVLFGENRLLLEVPQTDQAVSMWAVCRLVVGSRTGAELADLFDRADDIGREIVRGVFESNALKGWVEPEPSGPEESP